ncbi:contactin-associated protein-like 2 [Lytechinus pictus]|uniref:contactin-associated protein-like 2 n=1 Tax=Lytechinus pictus TaxID=7653 RepID=UPI0030BA2AF3
MLSSCFRMLKVVLLSSWICLLLGGFEPIKAETNGNWCPMPISGVQCKSIVKNGTTIQLVHKLVPLEAIKRMAYPGGVNVTWRCTEPACLSTPCKYGNCTEVDDGFECECPKGFGGARCEIYPPRNCAELKARDDITEDGIYVIDPDGEFRDRSLPVEMECLMTEGVTSVPHDITAQESTPYEMGVGEFVRNVTYPFDSDTILALIQSSKSCKQMIYARGYRSYIYAPDRITQNVWWVSRHGRKMPNWADTPSDHQGCSCSYETPSRPYNACPAGGRCNTDYSYYGLWQEDSGYLTDVRRLPVIRLHTGFPFQSGTRYLFYNLGPLLCEGHWS